MGTYTIAQAKDRFSKIIDEALAGSPVTITRHGKPIIRLVPEQPAPQPMTAAQIEAMFARAAKRKIKSGPSKVNIVVQMRNEER